MRDLTRVAEIYGDQLGDRNSFVHRAVLFGLRKRLLRRDDGVQRREDDAGLDYGVDYEQVALRGHKEDQLSETSAYYRQSAYILVQNVANLPQHFSTVFRAPVMQN